MEVSCLPKSGQILGIYRRKTFQTLSVQNETLHPSDPLASKDKFCISCLSLGLEAAAKHGQQRWRSRRPSSKPHRSPHQPEPSPQPKYHPSWRQFPIPEGPTYGQVRPRRYRPPQQLPISPPTESPTSSPAKSPICSPTQSPTVPPIPASAPAPSPPRRSHHLPPRQAKPGPTAIWAGGAKAATCSAGADPNRRAAATRRRADPERRAGQSTSSQAASCDALSTTSPEDEQAKP